MQNTLTGATAANAPKRTKRIAALDGLRALAIVGVVLYHMRPTLLTGGFLGVTVFFTLTGYFATKSVMRATAGKDGFSYPRYLARRIARMLPPILVTVAATALATYIVTPSLLPKVQQDALPSALFFSNWSYIFRNVSYFAAAGLPSPLTHLWFCGVTMQFYIVWPLVLMLLVSKTRERGTAIKLTAALAAISTVAMALMFNPQADTARVYYGTDTRAAELLVGALAAIAAPRLRHLLDGTVGKTRISRVDAVSAIALVAFVAGALTLTGETSWLYRGGFLLFAVLTALLIVCVQNTGCAARRLLSAKPLVYLGGRSFSIYLVHYPMLILMNPATRTTRIAWWEQLLQIVAILVVAEVFYRLVERPFAHGLPVHKTAEGMARRPSPAFALPAVGAVCVLVLALAPVDWNGIATARAQQLRPELTQTSQKKDASSGTGTAASSDQTQDQQAEQKTQEQQKPHEGPIAEKVPKNLDWKSFNYDESTGTCDASVIMIGDSVTAGAASGIQSVLPNAYVDGVVSRQFYTFQDVYSQDVANGHDGSVVICALGTNGLIRDAQMVQDVIDAVGGKPIYFVTVRVPLDLQDANNQMLRDVAAKNDNAGIIDWNGASEGHSEYLVDDGTHLTAAGIDAYSTLIRQALCGH